MNVFPRALASANETDQADFLNEFVDALDVMCRAADSSIGTQGHYIARNLTDKAAKFFGDLVGSYNYLREHTEKEVRDLLAEEARLRRIVADLRQKAEGDPF